MSSLSPEWLKAADRWLWAPAAAAGAALATTGLLRRRTDTPLVIRPGGLGDLVCAHIALEEIGVDPLSVLWVVEARAAAWAAQAGLRHVRYEEMTRLARLVGRHATVIDSEQRFGLSRALARAALAPRGELTCFSTNRAARWATRRMPYDPDVAHETVEFARLLGAALGRPAPPAPRLRRRLQPDGGARLVGVAGLQSPSRRLDVGDWSRLVREWGGDAPVTILAAPVDRAFARELCARLPAATLVQEDFASVCRRLAAAHELFTVDGGMAHIASYYGVPATVVFTSGRDRKWAPLSIGSKLIRRADLACQPCTLFGQTPPCPYGLECTDVHVPENLRPVTFEPSAAPPPRSGAWY